MRCLFAAALLACACAGRVAGPADPTTGGELTPTPVGPEPALVPEPEAAPAAAPAPPVPPTPIADRYRADAERILAAARADGGAWTKLAWLCDRIGHRFTGSRALEQAVSWAVATMKADGHDNVRAEQVMVPHWVRGAESAELV